jgi:uncharacterized membrane protein YsdA (DUF1294 family)
MNKRPPYRAPPSRQQARPRKGNFSLLNLLLLALLLVLPYQAVQASGWDWRWVAGYGAILSLTTYSAYALDKRLAESGGWRIPEFNLHFLEFFGGWPGAWIAQRRLRHKCAKRSYQIVFALILLIHQAAAFDAFKQWQLTRSLISFLDPRKNPSEYEVRRAIRLE